MIDKLGSKMTIGVFSLRGCAKIYEVMGLVEELVKVLKMNKVHRPAYFKYPVNGKGGEGFTYVQPISESFIAVDAWPKWGGLYVMICSCRCFKITDVYTLFRKQKYRIVQLGHKKLKLEGNENGL